MHKITIPALMFMLFCGCTPIQNSTELESGVSVAQLEAAVARYQQAGAAGDLDAIQTASSSYTFAGMHNNLISMKRKLTSLDVKNMVADFPVPATWDLIDHKIKGDTAVLIYQKKSANEENADQITFFGIRLVKEDDWKVDTKAWIVRDRVGQDGQPCEFDDQMLPPTCVADGLVLKGDELINEPDHVGYLSVNQPNGFVTKVSINGRQQSTANAQNLTSLIRGGLVNGSNKIRVEFSSNVEDGNRFPKIKIEKYDSENQQRSNVFEHELDNQSDTIEMTFQVSP